VSAPAVAPEKALPRELPTSLLYGALALVGIGVVAFIAGLASNPQHAWLAFHANLVYFTMLACGGIALSCIYTTVGAKWCGPYRRIAEAIGAFLPIAFVLSVVDFFGRDFIFEWVHAPAPGKEVWLNTTRVYATDFALLGSLAVLSVIFIKRSVRPTLKSLAETGQGFAKKQAEAWTSGWKGAEEERAAVGPATAGLAAIILLVFGIGMSFWNFDQVMSMDQMWFSNLFGAYVNWGGILSAVAASALIGILSRNAPGLGIDVTEARRHDIGKMMFAFSIFWMYLFFSQYLVIYYGNLPEETSFVRDRLGDQFLIDKGFSQYAFALEWTSWNFNWDRLQSGYGWIAMTVWALNWIIPFWVLLGQFPKKAPYIAGPVAGGLLLGFWLERNLLTWPSVVKGDMTAFLQPIPIGIALGFLGAFVTVYLLYARVFPTIAVTDKGD
jgi:hypothetical protein